MKDPCAHLPPCPLGDDCEYGGNQLEYDRKAYGAVRVECPCGVAGPWETEDADADKGWENLCKRGPGAVDIQERIEREKKDESYWRMRCPNCVGEGYILVESNRCTTCSGTGFVSDESAGGGE